MIGFMLEDELGRKFPDNEFYFAHDFDDGHWHIQYSGPDNTRSIEVFVEGLLANYESVSKFTVERSTQHGI